MSNAPWSLITSSFNTVNFAQDAEAHHNPRSHERARALMLHVGHRAASVRSVTPPHNSLLVYPFFLFSSDTLNVINIRTHDVEFKQEVER